MLLACLLLLPLPLVAWAQSVSVPSTWKNTTSFFTRPERISLAQGAIDQFISLGYPSGFMADAVSNQNESRIVLSIQMLSAISRKDAFAKADNNRNYVTGELDVLLRNDTWWTSNVPNYVFHLEAHSRYAMACIDAYKAYGGESYLDKAISLWSKIQANQVTSEDAGLGAALTCNGSSVIGAVADILPTQGSEFFYITSATNELFMTISAQLAELVSLNSTYADSAFSAAQSWQNFLAALSPRQGCAITSAEVDAKTCVLGTPSLYCSTHHAEGSAILANLKKNASMENILTNQVSLLMQSPSVPSTGVINETVLDGLEDTRSDMLANKFSIMIPIIEIWNRSVSQAPELATLLEAFTNIQLNALMANATIAGSNLYGTNWTGPPVDTYSFNAMSGAISALVAAIGPPPPSTNGSAGPDDPSSPATPPTSHRRSHKVAIGIGCGIAAAGVLFALVLFMLRRRQRQKPSIPNPEPFAGGLSSHDNSTVVLVGEKDTSMFWRGQAPNTNPHSSSLPSLQKRSKRTQEDVSTSASGAPSTRVLTGSGTVVGRGVSRVHVPEDVQQLLRRAEDLSDTSAADLCRRVEELGPIPEVIRAIQQILRNQNVDFDDLPQYEEGSGRDEWSI